MPQPPVPSPSNRCRAARAAPQIHDDAFATPLASCPLDAVLVPEQKGEVAMERPSRRGQYDAPGPQASEEASARRVAASPAGA